MFLISSISQQLTIAQIRQPSPIRCCKEFIIAFVIVLWLKFSGDKHKYIYFAVHVGVVLA
jgi:hypothetical protein